MKSCSITLKSIVVSGTDEPHQQAIEAEIRTILEALIKNDLDLCDDVQLSIIVTDQMEAAVDRTTAEYGRVVSAPYQQNRNSVRVAGIVVSSPQRPPVLATIILDIDPWMSSSGEEVAIRTYLVGHEFGHVLQHGRRIGLDWSQPPIKHRTYSSELARAATIIRDEFDADITASSVCKLFLQDEHGNEVLPASFFGYRFAGSAQDLLNQLCQFATVDVQGYRESSNGLNDLYLKIIPLLGELLVVLAHGAALYATANEVESFVSILEECPGFSEYIEPDWKSFIGALCEEGDEACEKEIVRIAEAVLNRLGLIVEDMADGNMYIHVHEPVFCADCDAHQ